MNKRAEEMTDQAKKMGDDVVKMGRNVWLAGLGAYSLAEEETRNAIDRLVSRGKKFEKDEKNLVSKTIDQATGKAKDFGNQVEDTVHTTVTSVLQRAGIPCGPINNVAEVVADPHVAARNMIIESRDPVAGEVRMAGNPVKISGFDDFAERASAPALDADRAAIVAEFAPDFESG